MSIRVKTFSKQEQKALEQYCFVCDSYRFGVVLCLYSGLRLGELCALRWLDVDLEEGVLNIRKSLKRSSFVGDVPGRKTSVILKAPKTSNGIRDIPLARFIVETLRLLYNMSDGDESFVLTGSEKYIEPNSYYKRYKRILRKVGLGEHTFHELRHTFATRCVEEGFDLKSLSEILGHANVQITMNVYVHPSREHKKKLVERLKLL